MASSSSTTWLISLKAILISTCAVSIAMVTKFSVPFMLNFAVYELPEIWSLILSWLKPPYLYILINGIIISIAASSRFHHHSGTTAQSEPLVRPISTPPSDLPPVSIQPALISVLEPQMVYESESPMLSDLKPMEINNINKVEEESEFTISRLSWNPPARMDSMENDQGEFFSSVKEKPLVSTRFGHRESVKSSPEGGRALRVAKPKRQDTLENTWRTITDGRHMPLARHLKKSDTFENHGRQFQVSDPASPYRVRKAETFRDRTNFMSTVEAVSSPGKLRKESSLGQDDLNRRVEAFIKKFNEEMRLQRQESLNQYKEMIKRGAH